MANYSVRSYDVLVGHRIIMTQTYIYHALVVEHGGSLQNMVYSKSILCLTNRWYVKLWRFSSTVLIYIMKETCSNYGTVPRVYFTTPGVLVVQACLNFLQFFLTVGIINNKEIISSSLIFHRIFSLHFGNGQDVHNCLCVMSQTLFRWQTLLS